MKRLYKLCKSIVTITVLKINLIILIVIYNILAVISIILGLSFVGDLEDLKSTKYQDLDYDRLQETSKRMIDITEQYVRQTLGHILMEVGFDLLGLFAIYWENFWLVLMYALIGTIENVVLCLTAPMSLHSGSTQFLVVIGIDSIFLIPVYLFLYLLSKRWNRWRVVWHWIL